MKPFFSFLLAAAMVAFAAAAEGESRADPDIFDGSLVAASGNGAGEGEGEGGAEVTAPDDGDDSAENGTAAGESEEGASGAEVSGNGEDSAAPDGAGSNENLPHSGGDATKPGEPEHPARGGVELGDLPEVPDVRIGGTGGIDRPVEPDSVEIPRVEMPRVPETGERRTEPAQTERETARDDPDEEPSDDARRVDRNDERQPRNEPVRRVGEGSTVPTDF